MLHLREFEQMVMHCFFQSQRKEKNTEEQKTFYQLSADIADCFKAGKIGIRHLMVFLLDGLCCYKNVLL